VLLQNLNREKAHKFAEAATYARIPNFFDQNYDKEWMCFSNSHKYRSPLWFAWDDPISALEWKNIDEILNLGSNMVAQA